MSYQNQSQKMNELLKPVLFQVIGSTPASIRDSVKKVEIRSNPNLGMLVATACVFSAAVNKQTMENFIASPDMREMRPILSSMFAINGKTNMTAMTLLGHSILTTKFVDSVDFCVEFRKKMGQDNLWAGTFANGSLSDKQKEILLEKQRVTSRAEAGLLGAGFLKYTGADKDAFTTAEAEWWGEIVKPKATRTASPGLESSRHNAPVSPERNVARRMIMLSDGRTARVRDDIARYYLAIGNNNESSLAASVERRGVTDFETMYGEAMTKDPERRAAGATVVG